MCHRFSPVPVRFNPVYRKRGRWYYQWDNIPVGPFTTEAEAAVDIRWHIQHPTDYWVCADPIDLALGQVDQ